MLSSLPNPNKVNVPLLRPMPGHPRPQGPGSLPRGPGRTRASLILAVALCLLVLAVAWTSEAADRFPASAPAPRQDAPLPALPAAAAAPAASETAPMPARTAPPVAPQPAAAVPESPPSPRAVTRRCRVTAYCPCAACCGRWARTPMARRTTAAGAPLAELIAAGVPFCAAASDIPFGTVIDIPGYGQAKVLDRGGAIRGDRLDVFFPNHQAALAWGVRDLTVTIHPAPDAQP